MNFYEQKIQQIKIALGMNVKMTESVLKDGVTKVEAESFEAGSKLFVVSESGETAPAPEGSHELTDGTKVTVDAEGTISEVIKPEPKVEVEINAAKRRFNAAAEEDPEEEKLEEEKPEDEVKEQMKKMIMQCMEAIEEVAKEVAEVKEEMAHYKSEKEKMSKTPGASKLSTFNGEASTITSLFENRLESLKAIKADLGNSKRKFNK